MTRRYLNIWVSRQVNISSTGHYHFKVYWDGDYRDYSLGVGFLGKEPFFDWNGAPAYLQNEVERQIVEMFKEGTAKFYEYDQDRNKRYTNLRYYYPENTKWWVKVLTGEIDTAPSGETRREEE
jgi:hypothetical protein